MKIADYFVAKLKAGEPDLDNFTASNLARAKHDGAAYFYDIPPNTSLEAFMRAVEVAFDMDADHAEVWGSDGYLVVYFN